MSWYDKAGRPANLEALRKHLFSESLDASLDDARDFIGAALWDGFGPGYGSALEKDLQQEYEQLEEAEVE